MKLVRKKSWKQGAGSARLEERRSEMEGGKGKVLPDAALYSLLKLSRWLCFAAVFFSISAFDRAWLPARLS